MNKYLNDYNRIYEKKIREINKNQLKDYWKLINKIVKRKKIEQLTLDSLFEFFKEVDNNPHNEQNDEEIIKNFDISNNYEILNSNITPEEIKKSINLLKNNKSSGNDGIINKYIKHNKDKMLPLYVTLFNIILETGIIPTQWSEGVIIPIYKNKGISTQPENQRPITLLPCIGKLFTSALNERFNNFLEINEILSESQAGFRKKNQPQTIYSH